MLKDHLPTYFPPRSDDLSIKPYYEIDFILTFVDNNISSFRTFYLTVKDSDHENRISDFLVHYFQLRLDESPYEGFTPIDFRRNPTQSNSKKETDIGVYSKKILKPITLIEFEAKRFYESSTNNQYVCGERGGIERFKRGKHASHLPICGMFGYVQSRSSTKWIKKVNEWINELSKLKLTDIDWGGEEEKLCPVESFDGVKKLKSVNCRTQPQQYKSIILYHYFINLME